MDTKIIKQYLLAALAGVALLTGCSKEDGPADGGEKVAVSFSGAIADGTLAQAVSTAPHTRTTDGGDKWAVGDEVGIYMLPASGVIGDAMTGAANKEYKITDATTGALAPEDGMPIYYPQSGDVDFIAYHPYGSAGNNAGEISTGNIYNINVTGQTDEAAQNAIDVMYAKKTGVAKGKTAVSLTFGHMLSKVTIHVKAGEGVTAGDISGLRAADVKFGGMPVTATLALQDGTLTAGGDLTQTFSPLKVAAAGSGAGFTTIIIPQPGMNGRKVVFTIGDEEFTGYLPTGDIFAAGNHYTYPVTVEKSGVTLGDVTITKWTTNDNNPGTATPLEVVKIKAGTFLMGSSDGSNPGDNDGSGLNIPPAEPDRYKNETQHWVELTKDFYMSKYQVTNTQYAAFLNANSIGSDGTGAVAGESGKKELIWDCMQESVRDPWGVTWDGSKWKPVDGYGNHPVVYVTWYGAKAYAGWVGGSLPTEAQWEYVCRTGTTTAYSYGDTDNGDYMWYDGNNGKDGNPRGTKAVGGKRANLWGLYDMHGNTNDWCADWYDENYYTDPSAGADPTGPDRAYDRVLRGSAWYSNAQYCRSAFRNYGNPNAAYNNAGFRVVFPAP